MHLLNWQNHKAQAPENVHKSMIVNTVCPTETERPEIFIHPAPEVMWHKFAIIIPVVRTFPVFLHLQCVSVFHSLKSFHTTYLLTEDTSVFAVFVVKTWINIR
jgi:hypothetical protein